MSRYTNYDVFLSFRGEDTRYGFTGNLYSALSQRGIFTFIDDEALQKGQELTPSLCKAIQESRISIVIFSKNYASSTFCLDELVQIIECHTKHRMWILPVFYDIDPSHVRHQKGSYKEALAFHESGRFKDDIHKLQKWRLALRQAADLSGYHLKFGGEYEFEFIKKITEEVSNKLNRPPLHIADYPVGLKAKMEQIQQLMDGEFDNKVIMLGIHGMGGIGKSTLARAIYNVKANQFESSCFVADVREKSPTKHHGLVQIQETMLSELVGERNIKLGDVHRGIPILQQRLCSKKVLVVLDDIDTKEQLQATAGGLHWFGSGSIIIITTRDKQLLNIHGVNKLYEVNELDDSEARKLLRWNAFKNKPDTNYMELIKRAIHYASGLPLALKVIGSNLLGKTLDEWESALEAYGRIPDRDVQKILRVSYDSLNANEQDIFLDIACFFKGCSLRYVTNVLQARGFCPEFGIGVLEKKSLIKIGCESLLFRRKTIGVEFVIMHDLIQSMGKEIVRQQSTWPQKRNRLWLYEDIVSVFEKRLENDEIEAMMLDVPDNEKVQWNQKVFGKMNNLQMMLIKENAGFLRSPKDLPNSLRVLGWREYPASSLPSNFHPRNLVIVDFSYSCFEWDKRLQKSKVLKVLILRGCKKLRQIPDISGLPNLTELCVCECINMTKIHDSLGSLHNLQWLCAEGCTKLMTCPCSIKLPSLEHLSFRDCSSLAMFPIILAPMHKLKYCYLGGTAINNRPLSIQNVEGIKLLNFFQNMSSQFFPSLTQLCLRGSKLTILPACIEECHSLKCLCLFDCKKLKEITSLPRSTTYLMAGNTLVEANSSTLKMLLRRAIASNTDMRYILPGQRTPEWFDYSTRGNTLRFWFRNELPFLTLCAVSGSWDNIKPPLRVKFKFLVTINHIDLSVYRYYWHNMENIRPKSDHVCVINIPKQFLHPMNSDIERALKMNQWICGNISFALEAPNEDSRKWEVIKGIGVYANRTFNRMEDIRFTDPHALNSNSDSQEVACSNDQDGAIESTISASESRKVDEVEEDLETNKSQFSRGMALVNELHQKLTSIEKMKDDLGEKLNAIKANIYAIEANNSSIKAIISDYQSESRERGISLRKETNSDMS